MPRGERLDTQVPSEGAEHLVLGMLCRQAISTFKAPAFRAAYDLVTINPWNKKSVTMQVKSRFQTDCDRSFTVRAAEADFFVFVFLNMGNWYHGRGHECREDPEFYVLPKAEVEMRIKNPQRKMPIFYIRRGDAQMSKFKDAWSLVAETLDIDLEEALTSRSSAAKRIQNKPLELP